MRPRGGASNALELDKLEPATGTASVDGIWETMNSDRVLAAKQVRAFLAAGGSQAALFDKLRRTAVRAGNDEHLYKVPIALIEEVESMSPAFKPLAASVATLYGPSANHADWPGYEEVRAAASHMRGPG